MLHARPPPLASNARPAARACGLRLAGLGAALARGLRMSLLAVQLGSLACVRVPAALSESVLPSQQRRDIFPPMAHSSNARSRRSAKPIDVAIIGGGCAGLTAAFELSRPEHQGRYRVTVYQMGWRLGGKGASGRRPDGRIEEHGLHLWMGFYENAFRLMRECYAELGRDPAQVPIATWQDAFQPAPWVAVADRVGDGSWLPWLAHFPPGRGQPGDGLHKDNPFTVRGYLQQAAALLWELLGTALAHGAPTAATSSDLPRTAAALSDAVMGLLRYGPVLGATALSEGCAILRAGLELIFPQDATGTGLLVSLIDALARGTRRQLDALLARDPAVARTWQVIDLILAILRGALVYGLAFDPRGFDAIDDCDWRDWLRQNGASAASLDSGFVRGIYDLAFAYEDGDAARPRLAASVALRGAMRMFFTYRGALFYRMTAGMGDIVFAPLYQVLRRRGVRFQFFHRLRHVQLSPSSVPDPHVTALHFDVQARTQGDAEYQPLIDVHGLPCWPAQPDYAQLREGAKLRRQRWDLESPWETRIAGEQVLHVGRDFDLVVLGLGVGAVPMVCRELIERSPKWRAMAQGCRSVATQALQLWLREDAAGLGWPHAPINLSGFVEPFDTWADMSHLIPMEQGRDAARRSATRSIAYFCSPLPDPPPARGDVAEPSRPGELPAQQQSDAFQVQQRAVVRHNAVQFLDHEIGALWPRAVRPRGGFRWDLLVASDSEKRPPAGRAAGAQRLDSQYLTANVRPSERYALSLPGTQKFRLSPLDCSFDNLTVAGDWTESGLNTGCVESAVMSGLLAAHAICQSPSLAAIVGYDHP